MGLAAGSLRLRPPGRAERRRTPGAGGTWLAGPAAPWPRPRPAAVARDRQAAQTAGRRPRGPGMVPGHQRSPAGGDRRHRADPAPLPGKAGLILGLVNRRLAPPDRAHFQGVHGRLAWLDRRHGPPLRGRVRLPARRLHRLRPAGLLQPPGPGLAGLRQGSRRGPCRPGDRHAAGVGLSPLRPGGPRVPDRLDPGDAGQPEPVAGGHDQRGPREDPGGPVDRPASCARLLSRPAQGDLRARARRPASRAAARGNAGDRGGPRGMG